MGFARIGSAGLALLLAALAVTGCGGSTEEETAVAGKPRTVNISDYLYSPAALTVQAGTRIVFRNEDTTAHTATSKQSGAFESEPIAPGKSATLTFDQPGTYAYYCVFHPFMKGKVRVEQ
jgi:plastocyanin